MTLSIAEIEKKLKESSTKKKTKYIGWISTYIPEEIIIAAGFQPCRIMGTTSPVGLANTYLIGNISSFVQGCLESALKREYDFLEGMVLSNDTDAMKRLYDTWIRTINTPFVHLIDTPKIITNFSIQKYNDEINNLILNFEDFFKIKITKDELKSAIILCNKTRALLNGINEFRKDEAPLISASDFLKLCKLSMVYSKEIFNDLVAEFMEDLRLGSRNNLLKGSKRVLLMGSFQDQPYLLNAIEENGCQVVCEDMCTRIRYFRDLVDEDDDPINALAKRYLNKPPSARMSDFTKRADYIKGLIEEFKIQAVVYYILKFDDPYLFEFPDMKLYINSLGLPVLRIESEHSSSATGQIKTRIQAFTETLI